MRKWTDEEVAILRRFAAKGFTDEEVGRVLSRGADSIQCKRSKLSIESRSPRGPKSNVANGKAKGGKVLVRLPKSLHEKLAEVCSENRESINDFMVRLIRREIV